MSKFHKICPAAQIPEGGRYPAFVEDEEILIVKAGGQIFAVADCCSHQDFPLAHGQVIEKRIKCTAHGAEFDLASGKALTAPAFAPIKTYPVEIRDGDIYVMLD